MAFNPFRYPTKEGVTSCPQWDRIGSDDGTWE
jgi:hypothetical protein